MKTRMVPAAVALLTAACGQAPSDAAHQAEPPETVPSHPADEAGEPIPAVDAAEYVLLEAKQLDNGNITALSRRHSAQSGSTYSYREYECATGMFRYLGSGDTRQDAEKVRFGSDPFTKLVDGSSAFLTGQTACAKFGKTITAPIP